MTAISETILYSALFIVLYFQVFLILTFVESRNKEKKWVGKAPGVHSELPSVTIIVPVFNEEETVEGTLDSLFKLNYPADKLQIMAIDDGSIDNTWEILTRYEKKEPRLKIIKKENGGKHTAVNLGLSHTTSDLVGCLDADSYVHPEALLRIVSRFDNEDIMAVTPAVVVYKPTNLLQMIQKAEYNMGLFTRKVLSSINSLHVAPGPFSIFRKKVFEKLGGYKKAYNTEDMEIALRMQEHHMKIANASDAYVYTVTPKTLKTLHVQRVRWIYGFIKNASDYRRLFFKREYGDFGMFYLPFAAFSILAALYFFFYMIFRLFINIYNKIVDVTIYGLDLTPTFKFDWFFLNTENIVFISIVFGLISLFVLITGRSFAKEKRLVGMDIVWFMILYGFISPFWFMRAIYNAVTSKQTKWR